MGKLINLEDYRKKKKNESSKYDFFSYLYFYGSFDPIYCLDSDYSFSYTLITSPISLSSIIEN